MMFEIKRRFYLYRTRNSQTPGGARDQPEKKVKPSARSVQDEQKTARYTLSDFSKLGTTYSSASSMTKLGMKPFAELKNSAKMNEQ